MKILVLLFTCEKNIDLVQAAVDTWLKDVDYPHYIKIVGSYNMPDSIGPHQVYKPLEQEAYYDLSRKVYMSFCKYIDHDWDYLIKCDDDTYVNFPRLLKFLHRCRQENIDYTGAGNYFIGRRWHLCNTQCNTDRECYAQGGAGYVLSKHAVTDILPHLQQTQHTAWEKAEDVAVGQAAKLANISFKCHANLFDSGFKDWKAGNAKKQTTSEALDMMRNEYITTHHVTTDGIYRIYSMLNDK